MLGRRAALPERSVTSKTVNVPEDVTVEDIEQLHLDAWRLGIKAVAIYRDNCKVAATPVHHEKAGAVVGEGGDSAPPGSEAEARDRAAATKIAELEAALAHEQGRSRDTVVVGAIRERLPDAASLALSPSASPTARAT